MLNGMIISKSETEAPVSKMANESFHQVFKYFEVKNQTWYAKNKFDDNVN